jgi:hypothetical protein
MVLPTVVLTLCEQALEDPSACRESRYRSAGASDLGGSGHISRYVGPSRAVSDARIAYAKNAHHPRIGAKTRQNASVSAFCMT